MGGKVPSQTAAFLACYAMVGVPLFGAVVSHRAATYVETQLRYQERENFSNRLNPDQLTAIRELRHGAVAARRSTRNSRVGFEVRDSVTGLRNTSPGTGIRQSEGRARLEHAPCASPTVMERTTSNERVMWGDFLALQVLRLRRVDFELLKDLREEYLEMIASSQENGGMTWDMLADLYAGNADEGNDPNS